MNDELGHLVTAIYMYRCISDILEEISSSQYIQIFSVSSVTVQCLKCDQFCACMYLSLCHVRHLADEHRVGSKCRLFQSSKVWKLFHSVCTLYYSLPCTPAPDPNIGWDVRSITLLHSFKSPQLERNNSVCAYGD